MRAFLIVWFTCLFVINCSFDTKKEKVVLKDPLDNSYLLDRRVIQESSIRDNLSYFLIKYNRKWAKSTRERCVNILYKGQQEFDIDYKIILSIISIESQFDIKAKGKNKNSIDYGLCQINSKYLKQRYKASEQLLKEYKIYFNKNDKYDIALNIFSSFMYLKDIHRYSDLIQFSDYITAYNQGVRGCKRNNDSRYYEKFMKEYMSI